LIYYGEISNFRAKKQTIAKIVAQNIDKGPKIFSYLRIYSYLCRVLCGYVKTEFFIRRKTKIYIQNNNNLNSKAMKVSHIEHLGIAVKSLEEAIPYWENVLGLKCYAIEEVADQKVKTAFFMIGQTKIELLEPTSEDSTIAKYIEKRGVGIHHMALACENIEEQLADAEAQGVSLIDKTPRKGAEGLTIAFLHPKSTQGILTELCEDKNK
jgi:methylmalonyl-CoA/ethylmalonyl-CoA epimerase